MSKKPYYNHDDTWDKRRLAGTPVWGSFSVSLYQRLLILLKEHLAAGSHILDIGCGAGKFGETVQSGGWRYTGIDESAVAIALGKQSWPEFDLRCVDFAVPLSPELALTAYDAIVSLNVLHCIGGAGERRRFLDNTRSCSKPGGMFLLTTMVGPLVNPYRESQNFRVYQEPETVLAELTQSGWAKVLHHNLLAASAVNPIPNLELLLQC